MTTPALTLDRTDAIRGVTLEERARLVLLTLGRTPAEIRKAYRRMARQHHPDTQAGDKETFQVINEAYTLLTGGSVPKRPLLADDRLLLKVAGRRVAPLIDRQKQWEEYERWRREHFYGVGVL
jgi:hypothetical protein